MSLREIVRASSEVNRNWPRVAEDGRLFKGRYATVLCKVTSDFCPFTGRFASVQELTEGHNESHKVPNEDPSLLIYTD